MDPWPLLLLTKTQVKSFKMIDTYKFLTLINASKTLLIVSASLLFLIQHAGSGLASVNKFHYGFFSAAIKLPAGLTSGVVVAFYVSSLVIYHEYTL